MPHYTPIDTVYDEGDRNLAVDSRRKRIRGARIDSDFIVRRLSSGLEAGWRRVVHVLG